MGLGRAQKLEWMLLRNFPKDDAGELDWSIFEKGPPDFLVEFLEALDKRAKATLPRLERARLELGMPSWEDVPHCAPDPAIKGRFLYDPAAWGKQVEKHPPKLPKKCQGTGHVLGRPRDLHGARPAARAGAASGPGAGAGAGAGAGSGGCDQVSCRVSRRMDLTWVSFFICFPNLFPTF